MYRVNYLSLSLYTSLSLSIYIYIYICICSLSGAVALDNSKRQWLEHVEPQPTSEPGVEAAQLDPTPSKYV